MEDSPAFIPREASKDTLRLSLIERSHRSHTGSYESSTGFKRLWDSTSRLSSIGPDHPLSRHKHGVCWVRSLLPPNIQEILMCIVKFLGEWNAPRLTILKKKFKCLFTTILLHSLYLFTFCTFWHFVSIILFLFVRLISRKLHEMENRWVGGRWVDEASL